MQDVIFGLQSPWKNKLHSSPIMNVVVIGLSLGSVVVIKCSLVLSLFSS